MNTPFDLEFLIQQPQPAKPKALVVLLHGVGGNETNLASLVPPLEPDTLVVMPRGPMTLGAGQYAWFRVNFTGTGPVIAGFSQGGILSASVGLSEPGCVAGFAVLSGRILPELQPHIADHAQLQHLHAFIGHGEYDSKLPVVWAQRSEQLLSDLGVESLTRRYPIDHGISGAMQADFLSWLRTETARA